MNLEDLEILLFKSGNVEKKKKNLMIPFAHLYHESLKTSD